MKERLIALQVYSVRDAAEADFAGTMRKVKEMGYNGVELAGTYGMTAVEAKKILARARECHFPVSQQEVRSVLSEMSKQGLARVSRGRGGSRLTPKGRRLWEDHQDRF